MKQDKTDRRSQRSRRLLAGALISLMQEQPYDAITVQDILDRADVGRSTFYAHYFDKEDLLISEFERVIALLTAVPADGAGAGPVLPTTALFTHIAEHHGLYRALVKGRRADLLFRRAQEYLTARVAADLSAQVAGGAGASSVPLPLVATFVTGSLLSLLQWWLDHNMSYPADVMDAMFQRLVGPGVGAALAPPAAAR